MTTTEKDRTQAQSQRTSKNKPGSGNANVVLYDVSSDSIRQGALVPIGSAILSLPPTAQAERCLEIIKRLTSIQDGHLIHEIAAGAAADFIFGHGLHRRQSMDQSAYCLHYFGRHARTVRDWRDTASIYTRIGGLSAMPQPDAFSQVLAVKQIVESRQKEAWEAQATVNHGRAPTGHQIREWAAANGAFRRIPRRNPGAPVTPNSTSPTVSMRRALACVQALRKRAIRQDLSEWAHGFDRLDQLLRQALADRATAHRRVKLTTPQHRYRDAPGQLDLFCGPPSQLVGAA